MRESVGAPVERGVVERLALEDDGRAVRRRARLRLERARAARPRAGTRRASRSTRRAGADRPPTAAAAGRSAGRRRAGRRRDDRLEVTNEPLDRPAVEEVRVVLGRAAQPVRRLGERHRQVELRRRRRRARAATRSRRRPPPAWSGDSAARTHLEERRVAEAPLRLQRLDELLERQVLVRVGVERRVPHARAAARGTCRVGRQARPRGPAC